MKVPPVGGPESVTSCCSFTAAEPAIATTHDGAWPIPESWLKKGKDVFDKPAIKAKKRPKLKKKERQVLKQAVQLERGRLMMQFPYEPEELLKRIVMFENRLREMFETPKAEEPAVINPELLELAAKELAETLAKEEAAKKQELLNQLLLEVQKDLQKEEEEMLVALLVSEDIWH